MKIFILPLSICFLLLTISTPAMAMPGNPTAFGCSRYNICPHRQQHDRQREETKDITSEIPLIDDDELEGYEKVSDVAQYKGADWSNVVGMQKGITLRKAKAIADDDPEITFFFFTKAPMTLERGDGHYHFNHGDTVFFSGQPHWGSARGLADGYIKQDI